MKRRTKNDNEIAAMENGSAFTIVCHNFFLFVRVVDEKQSTAFHQQARSTCSLIRRDCDCPRSRSISQVKCTTCAYQNDKITNNKKNRPTGLHLRVGFPLRQHIKVLVTLKNSWHVYRALSNNFIIFFTFHWHSPLRIFFYVLQIKKKTKKNTYRNIRIKILSIGSCSLSLPKINVVRFL